VDLVARYEGSLQVVGEPAGSAYTKAVVLRLPGGLLVS
jgi:hypothetical protein